MIELTFIVVCEIARVVERLRQKSFDKARLTSPNMTTAHPSLFAIVISQLSIFF